MLAPLEMPEGRETPAETAEEDKPRRAPGKLVVQPAAKKRRTQAVPRSTHATTASSGAAAQTKPARSKANASEAPMDETSRLAMRKSLAMLFDVSEERVSNIRKIGTRFSLIDVACVTTGCEGNEAGQKIREVLRQHPELQTQVVYEKFPGRGQRDTPTADVYVVVDFIMLLPGKRAAALRRNAAELFVRYHGGDLRMAQEITAARERQEQLLREEPEHPLRAFGEAVEEQRLGPASSRRNSERQQLADESLLMVEELRRSTGLKDLALTRRAMLVQTCFLELLRREAEAQGGGAPELARGRGASLAARNLRCTRDQLPLLQAAMAQAAMLEERQDAVVALHIARGDGADGTPRQAAGRTAPVGFRVVDAEHSAAKDAANEAFVRALDRFGVLRGPDNIFFLDHWAEGPATSSSAGSVLPSCRTTAALLGAGVDPRRLFSANKDLGIVAWLRGRGANAFHGDWRDALAAASGWPEGASFGGVYLDACGGSSGALLEQLEAWLPRATPRCVLAWTLVERDFGGESLIRRVLRLVSFLQDKGWTPAADTLELATLCHRSSGGGQQVVTQIWARGGHSEGCGSRPQRAE